MALKGLKNTKAFELLTGSNNNGGHSNLTHTNLNTNSTLMSNLNPNGRAILMATTALTSISNSTSSTSTSTSTSMSATSIATDDVELILDSAVLYRKDSSSGQSSLYESEILTKKAEPELFNSITYRQLHSSSHGRGSGVGGKSIDNARLQSGNYHWINNNCNNDSLSDADKQPIKIAGNSTSSANSNSTTSSPNTSSTGSMVRSSGNGVIGGDLTRTGTICGGMNVGVVGCSMEALLSSLHSSSSTPPPEYELRELTHPLMNNSFNNKFSSINGCSNNGTENSGGSGSSTRSTLPSSYNLSSLMAGPQQHRELPVDVPESFVEIVKTAPCYPPLPSSLAPISLQMTQIPSNGGVLSLAACAIDGKHMKTTPPVTLKSATMCSSTPLNNFVSFYDSSSIHNQQETSLTSNTALNGSAEDHAEIDESIGTSQLIQEIDPCGIGKQLPQPQVVVTNGSSTTVLTTFVSYSGDEVCVFFQIEIFNALSVSITNLLSQTIDSSLLSLHFPYTSLITNHTVILFN